MIHQGDALSVLRSMPDESVQLVVTSPPYWNLRTYGDFPGELGREKTVGEYIGRLVEVFQEVRRVLRADGLLFLNIEDSYASGKGTCRNPGGGPASRIQTDLDKSQYPRDRGSKTTLAIDGLKPKDRCLIPERLAIALQEDGWWVRQPIIWYKPAPMPSSAKGRCTDCYERIWLLAKSAQYKSHFDRLSTPAKSVTRKMPDGWDTGEGAHGTIHRQGREKGRRSDKQRGVSRQYDGFNDRWDAAEENGTAPDMAWPRSVWEFSTARYKKGHFATFPEELPKRCILAGSDPGDVVLDPFAGTGTTLAVALRLGRVPLGIELNPEYIELAKERLRGVTLAMEEVA